MLTNVPENESLTFAGFFLVLLSHKKFNGISDIVVRTNSFRR